MTLPYSFSAGEIAKSAEVNENFVFLKDRITTTASALQTSINSVQNSVSSVTTRVNGHDTSISNINTTISGLGGSYTNLSFSNANSTAKYNTDSWCMPKYASPTSRSANTNYTAGTNGWVKANRRNSTDGDWASWNVLINGTEIYYFITGDQNDITSPMLPVPKGATYKSNRAMTWYPCVGG